MGKIMLRTALQKVGITGTNLYVTRPVRYSTIQTEELIQMMAHDSGVPRPMARACAEAILQQIEQLLLNGHAIQFGQIGTFSLSAKIKSQAKKENVNAGNLKRWRILLTPSVEFKKKIEAVELQMDLPQELQAIIKQAQQELLDKKESVNS